MTLKVWLYIGMLALHALVCVLVYFLIKMRFFKAPLQLMPVVIFVPVFGLASMVIAWLLILFKKDGSREIQLEELKIKDEAYRLMPDEGRTETSVVPLEEAIAINDEQVRRRLIMDILRQDPAKYIDLLQQARLANDVEVTHYASTAMMEIQRDFEMQIKQSEEDYQQNPDDPRALAQYAGDLGRYIKSGLLQDNALFIQRLRYGALLKEKMEENPQDKQAFLDAADNELELGNFDSAKELISQAIKQWPEDERAYVCKLKCCHLAGDGAAFDKTLKQMQEKGLYLSRSTRQILAFWGYESRGGAADAT